MRDPCSPPKQALLTLSSALYALKNAIKPLKAQETIPVGHALGRVLALPINAPMNSPQFRNSAMDGYAFASGCASSEPFSLRLAGVAYAGQPFTGALKQNHCVRIFTGAVVPAAADTVVMQEEVTVVDNTVFFAANTVLKQNVREIGEDIAQGERLLAAGKKLSAVDIGLLVSVGVSEVVVTRPVRIAVFSTGDELVPLGQPLAQGQLHDSNRYMLMGLLTGNCYEITDGGIIADNSAQLEARFLQAASVHDVIISTGGASVGDADYVKSILQQHGAIHFWKLAIKPGKPFAFGQLDKCYFFGLPGNPVAVVATFQQLVLPALQQLSGAGVTNPLRLSAVCSCNLYKVDGRQDFQRGILTQDASGEFFVTSAGAQGSHLLIAMSRANCFIVLPIHCKGVVAGERVMVEPFLISI